MKRTLPNTAFYQRLQGDQVDICDVLDVTLPTGEAFHWTTANGEITYTLSGAPTIYHPFPGKTVRGTEEGMKMAVSVVDFIIANSGDALQGQLLNGDFAMAKVLIGRVFTDTPDLGRYEVYDGKVGDFSYNRQEITGQARNLWKGLNVQWPFITYNDHCGWKFGSTPCGYNTSSVTVVVSAINVGSSTALDILCPSGTLSSSWANGRFEFGRATVTFGANSGQVRTIRTHTGDLLSMSHPLPYSDMTSMQLSIWPGCSKRLIIDCKSIYGNSKHALAFPWIPAKETAYS